MHGPSCQPSYKLLQKAALQEVGQSLKHTQVLTSNRSLTCQDAILDDNSARSVVPLMRSLGTYRRGACQGILLVMGFCLCRGLLDLNYRFTLVGAVFGSHQAYLSTVKNETVT